MYSGYKGTWEIKLNAFFGSILLRHTRLESTRLDSVWLVYQQTDTDGGLAFCVSRDAILGSASEMRFQSNMIFRTHDTTKLYFYPNIVLSPAITLSRPHSTCSKFLSSTRKEFKHSLRFWDNKAVISIHTNKRVMYEVTDEFLTIIFVKFWFSKW